MTQSPEATIQRQTPETPVQGCDSTFFATQEAAIQRIRDAMRTSDDPRIVGE